VGRGRAVLCRAGGAARARRPAAGRQGRANLPNNHLAYAVTWYGLAVVVLMFGFWLRSRAKAAG